MNSLIRCLLFVIFLLFNLVLSGCGAQPYPVEPDRTVKSQLRVLNSLSNDVTIDFYLDNKIIFSNTKNKYVSSINEITPSQKRFKFTESGKTSSLLEGNITIDSGKSHLLGIIEGTSSPKTITYNEWIRTIPISKSSIRFINLSSKVQAIDIIFKIASVATEFKNLAYKSSSAYTEFSSGLGLITIKKPPTSTTLLINSFNFLPSNKYSLVIFDAPPATDSSGLIIRIINESNSEYHQLINPVSGISKLRLINFNHREAEIKVLIDSNSISQNQSFKSSSDYLFIPSGLHRLRIFTSTNQILIDSAITFIDGARYSASFYSNNSIPAISITEIPNITLPTDKCNFRINNVSEYFDVCDIEIRTPLQNLSIQNVAKNSTSDYFSLNPSEIQFFVKKGSVQFSAFSKTLNIGRYTLFLFGNPNDTGANSLGLYLINDSDTSSQYIETIEPAKAKIRCINGTINISSLTYKNGNNVLFQNANIRDASPVLGIPPGNKNIKLFQGSSQTPLLSFDNNFKVEKNYLLIASKSISNIEKVLVESDLNTPIANQASIRIINCAYDNPAFDISLKTLNDIVTINNLNYSQSTDYYNVQNGNIEIKVSYAGQDVVILNNLYNFNPGNIYSLIILGSESSSTEPYSVNILNESLLTQQKLTQLAPPPCKIKLINCSYDSPKLDLNISSAAVSGIGFKVASRFYEISSGLRSFNVKLTSSGNQIYQGQTSLVPMKNYYTCVSNKLLTPDITIIETPSKTAPANGNSIRFINLAYDIPQLDINITDVQNVKTIQSLNYRSSSNYIDLTSQYNEIVVSQSGTNGTILATAQATFDPEKVYTCILTVEYNQSLNKNDYTLNFIEDGNISEQQLFAYSKLNMALLKVINASSNSNYFDITIDGIDFFKQLSYTQSTNRQVTRTSIRNIKAFHSGTSSPNININYSFEKDKNYTMTISDSLSKLKSKIYLDDYSNFEIGKAFVRFINESPNSNGIDIKIGSSIGLIKHSNMTYQSISGYEKYDPQIISFIITENNKTIEIASLKSFNLSPNKIYTMVIMGIKNGPEGQKLELKWYPDN